MDESYETSETYEIVTSAPANPKLALFAARSRRPADAVQVLGATLRGRLPDSGRLDVTHTELYDLVAPSMWSGTDKAAAHDRRALAVLSRTDRQTRSPFEYANRRSAALRARSALSAGPHR